MGEMAEYYAEQMEELDAQAERERQAIKDAVEKAAQIWVTKDGRQIPIEKMSDAHLESAIRYFTARGAQSAVEYRKGDRSPVVVAETKMVALQALTILRYENLVKEQERRKGNGRGPG